MASNKLDDMDDDNNQSNCSTVIFKGLLCNQYIDHVEDRSDDNTKRARVFFKNGLELSVIRGVWSYGGDEGLFEIAPFNIQGEMDGSMFDDEDAGDDVCGYCTPEKVQHYIKKIGSMDV